MKKFKSKKILTEKEVLALNYSDYSEYMWQTCKKCHRKQRFEFAVTDELWHKLPKKWWNHCLCIECFIEELNISLKEYVELSKDDFRFLAIVSNKAMVTLLDDGSDIGDYIPSA